MEGCILDIQKLSTEDGPGIRTTVFFKGCNLRCAWCHNPESIPAKEPGAVGEGALHRLRLLREGVPDGRTDFRRNGRGGGQRTNASGCLACAEACPTGAMERKGTAYTVEALAAELLKDKAYFEKSDGGVTASGGEPLLQADFVRALLGALRAQGVHTALDTAANMPWETMESVLEVKRHAAARLEARGRRGAPAISPASPTRAYSKTRRGRRSLHGGA